MLQNTVLGQQIYIEYKYVTKHKILNIIEYYAYDWDFFHKTTTNKHGSLSICQSLTHLN